MGPSAQGPDALIGQIVAGYRLERVLGVGATGAVFLGSRIAAAGDAAAPTDATPADEATPASPVLPATAAIKLLFVPWQLSAEQAEEFRLRFLREAATLSQLRHPHLLPVLASGRDDATGHLYMVMPHVAGTLAVRLTAGGALALDTAASILDQLAGALDYAHSQGVIHRDIKPANILLDERGGVYLGDFGILRLLDESRTQLTATGGVLGTPEYMAPEQARGEDVGPAADRYSLAVVLYQMVTGHLPFEGGTPASLIVRQMQDPPPIPRSYRNDLPQPAEAVILKGLAKRPADRFALATQLSQAFAEGLAGILSPLVTPTGPQQAQTLNDGRVMETPATPPPTPLPWTPYPETPALTTGAVAGAAAPSRRRKGLLWGSLGAAALLLLTAAVLAALVRPDLAQALFGGKATAKVTATLGQVAEVHRGTATATPVPGGALLWQFQTEDTFNSSSLTVANGITYDGAGAGYVYALDADTGAMLWKTSVTSLRSSADACPVPISQVVKSTIYASSCDEHVYALNTTTGAVLWKTATVGDGTRPVVVDGTVYVATGSYQNDFAYALDAATGAVKWQTPDGDVNDNGIVVVDGKVYFGAADNNVYALDDSTGAIAWTFKTGTRIFSTPAVSNGIAYINSEDGTLFALNAMSGIVRWKLNHGFGSPAADSGRIYVDGDNGNLLALDATTGHTEWASPVGSTFGAPTIAGGSLYVGCGENSDYLCAVDEVTGNLRWKSPVGGTIFESPIVANGRVYVGPNNHTTYAFVA